MLGSVRALYCMSYRCMSVYGRCERDKIVLMVQMGAVSAVSAVGIERAVSTERAVSIERAVSSVGAEVAAQGLDGARVASVARGADHWGPRQSRSWDTHGGRRACMARRLCRVLRACGACVWCVRRGLRGRGRSARPGVPSLAWGVAAEASAGGPRRRAWRTEWLRTCEFQKRVFITLHTI